MDAQEQRRLLELAAKAIGGRITQWDGGTIFHPKTGHAFDWCPIDDDGDAIRLAVLLNLSVKHGVDIWDDNQKMSAYAYFGDFGECFFEEHGSDPYAATRLAIVRAAAAIGEKMEAKP